MTRKRGPTWREIVRAFDDAEDEFGEDRSTEFLIHIVMDRLRVPYEDVMESLYEQATRDEAKKEKVKS